MLDTIHTLYRCRRARKPACAEQKNRKSPTSGRLLVDDRSSCRCSCAKDWYSARQASTSLPLVQPFSSSPSKSLLKSWKGATSSPPTTIAEQKQLNPCKWRIAKQRLTGHNSQFFQGNDGHHDKIMSVNIGYWLCPMQPSHGYQRESLYRQVQGTAND